MSAGICVILLAAECGKLDYNIGLLEGVASDRILSNDPVWSQIPSPKAKINGRFLVKRGAEPIVCVNAGRFDAREHVGCRCASTSMQIDCQYYEQRYSTSFPEYNSGRSGSQHVSVRNRLGSASATTARRRPFRSFAGYDEADRCGHAGGTQRADPLERPRKAGDRAANRSGFQLIGRPVRRRRVKENRD